MAVSQKNKRQTLNFSRWIRKNYAVFSSLGKVVKICRLSVDICENALLKAFRSGKKAILASLFSFSEEMEEFAFEDLLTTENLMLAVHPTITQTAITRDISRSGIGSRFSCHLFSFEFLKQLFADGQRHKTERLTLNSAFGYCCI